mmetsp:Transcript_70051/g.164348  ORF Transcript_70051/g.164348 Transcript_70051/m.164348 type:complete len:86 (-) Transcript_70051:1987-2244(-)
MGPPTGLVEGIAAAALARHRGRMRRHALNMWKAVSFSMGTRLSFRACHSDAAFFFAHGGEEIEMAKVGRGAIRLWPRGLVWLKLL